MLPVVLVGNKIDVLAGDNTVERDLDLEKKVIPVLKAHREVEAFLTSKGAKRGMRLTQAPRDPPAAISMHLPRPTHRDLPRPPRCCATLSWPTHAPS